MRGEDIWSTAKNGNAAETPPRAWGRPDYQKKQVPKFGNTPTCVGKTPSILSRLTAGRKHPHVRGEDVQALKLTSEEWETPPRAWGRPQGCTTTAIKPRNTPTCVGKTLSGLSRIIKFEKHPHVRGEDRPGKLRKTFGLETPPRAWGRLKPWDNLDQHYRNTPTCVGKTRADTSAPTSTRKHPHVRGEDGIINSYVTPDTETPPRAWGRRHNQ